MGIFSWLFGDDDSNNNDDDNNKRNRNYIESKHKNPNDRLLDERCVYIQNDDGKFKRRDGGWTDNVKEAGKFSYREWQIHDAADKAKKNVRFRFGWSRVSDDDDDN